MERDEFVEGLLEAINELMVMMEEYELLDEELTIARNLTQQLYEEIESLQ